MASRRMLTQKQKEAILERDGHVCYYCGGEATVVDHIIPWDWSHNNAPTNLIAACNLCNILTSDMIFDTLEDKRKYIIKQRKKRRKRFLTGPFMCNQCGKEFIPCVKKATNFMCAECAEELC